LVLEEQSLNFTLAYVHSGIVPLSYTHRSICHHNPADFDIMQDLTFKDLKQIRANIDELLKNYKEDK
jgi:hypothetical protein